MINHVNKKEKEIALEKRNIKDIIVRQKF